MYSRIYLLVSDLYFLLSCNASSTLLLSHSVSCSSIAEPATHTFPDFLHVQHTTPVFMNVGVTSLDWGSGAPRSISQCQASLVSREPVQTGLQPVRSGFDYLDPNPICADPASLISIFSSQKPSSLLATRNQNRRAPSIFPYILRYSKSRIKDVEFTECLLQPCQGLSATAA